MLKKLMAVAGLAGTLGVAAPAFADWYRPPVYAPVPAPMYGMPVQRGGYWHGRDDWRRREEWRRAEWGRWHHSGWGHRHYRNW